MPRGFALLAAAVMLAATQAACSADKVRPQRNERPTMQTQNDIVAALNGIDDSFIVAADEAQLRQRTQEVLAGLRFDGIVLRLPKRIDRAATNSIPLLIVLSQDGSRSEQVPLSRNAVLVVTQLRSGRIWTVPAFPPDAAKLPRANRRAPPPQSEEATMTRMTSVIRRDLAAGDAPPWTNGEYALRIIAYDWTSNAVPLVLSNGVEAPPSSPLGEFVRGAPGGALPSFEATAAHPVPSASGLAISARGTQARKSGPIEIRGSLALPAQEVRANAGGVSAVQGSLLFVRENVVNPLRVDLAVPGQRSTDGQWSGHFAVDVARMVAVPPARYLVYLAVGHRLSPSLALAVE
jgi:hypothetical protein